LRQLASIQKIIKIDPIPDKDRIELATILGWEVIVGKEEFKVGDLCVYIEADSILPEREEFEFLRKRCWSPKWNGFRIRNMKMAGVYSQGIVFDLNILPEKVKVKEDLDVTEVLDIRKYDPELWAEIQARKQLKNKLWIVRIFLRIKFIRRIFFPKSVRGRFPSFVNKTDETRVQVLPHILEKYKGLDCYETEKLDGTSTTYAVRKKVFYVCSRNVWKKNPDRSVYWHIAKVDNIEKKLKREKKDICIQGEIIGPDIQGNKYRLPAPQFFVYNVYDIVEQRYYNFIETKEFCDLVGFKIVPILKVNWKLRGTVKDILERSKGKSLINPKIPREGIVIRSMDRMHNLCEKGMIHNLFSFKAVNPDFDLKYGKEN
jgi:hypothetical protein